MEELLNQILPLVIAAIVGIIAVIVKSVGDVTIKYLNAKKEEVILKIGIVEYEKRLQVAFSIWGIVDEHFRINDAIDHTVEDKINLFDCLLLEKIPGLKKEDLEFLRQSIAGKVNSGRDVVLNKEV